MRRTRAHARHSAELPAKFEGVWRNYSIRESDGSKRSSAFYSVIDDEWPTVRENLIARIARCARYLTSPTLPASAPAAGGQEVVLAFPYDGHLVAAVRTLPGRKFDWDRREWSAPADGWVAAKLTEILRCRPELTRTSEFDDWLAAHRARWTGYVRTTRYDGRGWFALDTLAGTPPEALRDGRHRAGPALAGAAHAARQPQRCLELHDAKFTLGARRCMEALEHGETAAARRG